MAQRIRNWLGRLMTFVRLGVPLDAARQRNDEAAARLDKAVREVLKR